MKVGHLVSKHGMVEAVVILLLKISVQIESRKKKETLERWVVFTREAVFLFLSINKNKIPSLQHQHSDGCRYMTQTSYLTLTLSLSLSLTLTL